MKNLEGVQFDHALNFIQEGNLYNITRRQMYFLILASTLSQSTFKACNFIEFNIYSKLCAYYLLLLRKKGYFKRISKGVYQIDDLGHELLSVFFDKFEELKSKPFTWL